MNMNTASPSGDTAACRHCGRAIRHLAAGQGWVHEDGYKLCEPLPPTSEEFLIAARVLRHLGRAGDPDDAGHIGHFIWMCEERSRA